MEIAVYREADANIVKVSRAVRDRVFGTPAQLAYVDELAKKRELGQLDAEGLPKMDEAKRSGGKGGKYGKDGKGGRANKGGGANKDKARGKASKSKSAKGKKGAKAGKGKKRGKAGKGGRGGRRGRPRRVVVGGGRRPASQARPGSAARGLVDLLWRVHL